MRVIDISVLILGKSWPCWMTKGGEVLRGFRGELGDGSKILVCHLLPFVSTQTADIAPQSIPRQLCPPRLSSERTQR